MALDPRFVVTADIEEFFLDKDSGQPLSGGTVTFYSDVNRTIKKPVYELTGSPPNYSYSALPNPIEFSAVGSYVNASGDPIVPYYFPYAGIPSLSNGTIELYYIEVRNSDGVLQFTREGWPNFTANNTTASTTNQNLIPNGQFLTHTDIVNTLTPPVTSLSNIDYQYVAQGGWVFRRTTGGTSTFNNSFTRIVTAVAGLNDYPRYAFNFNCSSFSATDQIRDLMVMFRGVNTFSSGNPAGSSPYTFTFAAESLDAGSYTFDVRLIRNYGTGGSPSTEEDTSIGSVIITASYGYFQVTISGIAPATGTLGTNNDDFIGIALRGPSSAFSVQLTDFSQLEGDTTSSFFPIQTSAQVLSSSVAGWMDLPNPDASDFYLPLVLTSKGMTWDSSQISKIEFYTDLQDYTGSIHSTTNLLLCDGSEYLTSDYSPLGIPYSRLQAKYWDSSTNIPQFGTGLNFATTYVTNAGDDIFRIATNKAGSQTATADVSTGFTFSALFTGSTSYNILSYFGTNGDVYYYTNALGASFGSNSAGTSGFTIDVLNAGNASTFNLTRIIIGSPPAAGAYFNFSNTTTQYYMWFTIDGAGSDPAPGGTGVLVPLLSTYSTSDIARIVREALNGTQSSNVETVAAASLTAGDYWTFFANAQKYAVWYSIDGAGSEPSASAINLQVTLSSTDDAGTVALKTRQAINRYKFAVPDASNAFFRAVNFGTGSFPSFDSDDNRFSIIDEYTNANDWAGTWEYFSIQSHLHDFSGDFDINEPPISDTAGDFIQSNNNAIVYTQFAFGGTTDATGEKETRPFNLSIVPCVRY